MRYKAAGGEPMKCLDGCKPEISYPCQWQYKLIGEERTAILAVIEQTVDIARCQIVEGNASSSGKYLSLNLEIEVISEAERLRLYEVFSNHSAIRVVL